MKKTIFFIFLILPILFVLGQHLTLHAVAAEESAAPTEGHGETGGEHEETLAQVIGKWINFSALVAILYLFLKKSIKVQDKFKTDSELIQKSIESARRAKEEAEGRLQELDRRMLQLNDEVEKIKREAAQEAEGEKKRILEAAQKEAERIVDQAQREIDAEVIQAKKELRKQVADLAVDQSRKIIKEEINDQDHKRLISDYIKGFGK